MRLIFICSFLLVFSWTHSQENPPLTKKEQKFVDRILQETSSSELLPVSIQDKCCEGLLMEGDRVFILKKQEIVLGYLLSTRALGRYDYFDYSILYSNYVSVLGLTVTAYRSSHGAAICQRRWLDQFEGYQGEELSLGKQIDGISGATISATALLLDMKRTHLLIRQIKDEGLFQ